MSKIKPERVAGIVALSYLVLIPAGAFYAWSKIRDMELDVDYLWDNAGLRPREPRGPYNLHKLKQAFRNGQESQKVS